MTTEFNGVPVREAARFRAYGSWWESFLDYGDLIRRLDRYADARAAAMGAPADYLQAIHRAGYATDPRYVTSCTALINQWNHLL